MARCFVVRLDILPLWGTRGRCVVVLWVRGRILEASGVWMVEGRALSPRFCFRVSFESHPQWCLACPADLAVNVVAVGLLFTIGVWCPEFVGIMQRP